MASPSPQHRDLAARLNRGKLPPDVITRLVGLAMSKGYRITRCTHCPQHGPTIHDPQKGTARCLACGRSVRPATDTDSPTP